MLTASHLKLKYRPKEPKHLMCVCYLLPPIAHGADDIVSITQWRDLLVAFDGITTDIFPEIHGIDAGDITYC